MVILGRRATSTVLAALALAVLAGCGGEGKKDPKPIDPAAALASVPGVVALQEIEASQGYRRFLLELEQPEDHAAPSGAKFRQFATLLWKDEHRPMVLATNGYFASRNPGRSELTALLDANQLAVEHRFFQPSSPAPGPLGGLSWELLTIEQAAADHHRFVQALRPVLGGGAWISVGASKGGMTAAYHRRFYPADVDGTLAYVAPQSFSTSDPAYVGFIEGVGGAGLAACRAALETYQREMLSRRAELEPLLASEAQALGETLTTFGVAKSFEYGVVELSFTFWQYGSPGLCGSIPGAGAAAAALYDFADVVFGGSAASGGFVDYWSDSGLAYYAPYYYQSATQLGGPAYPQAHLLDLLPGGVETDDYPHLYPPLDATKVYDADAMPDVRDWVSTAGERLMFIYGEYDPWSSQMFEPSSAKDSWRYAVPAGNHSANVTQLPDADRAAATATLRRWAGLPANALAVDEIPDFDPWVLLTGERGAPRDHNSPNRDSVRPLRLDGSGSAR